MIAPPVASVSVVVIMLPVARLIASVITCPFGVVITSVNKDATGESSKHHGHSSPPLSSSGRKHSMGPPKREVMVNVVEGSNGTT